MSKKYLYPLDKIHKPEWIKELQNPIQITPEEIIRDMFKFVKDFPIEVIPHMTEDELQARSKERESKPKDFDALFQSIQKPKLNQNLKANEASKLLSPTAGDGNPPS